nr:hypothetical protein Iba_chr06bCG11890 [Ipomoea batatas]
MVSTRAIEGEKADWAIWAKYAEFGAEILDGLGGKAFGYAGGRRAGTVARILSVPGIVRIDVALVTLCDNCRRRRNERHLFVMNGAIERNGGLNLVLRRGPSAAFRDELAAVLPFKEMEAGAVGTVKHTMFAKMSHLSNEWSAAGESETRWRGNVGSGVGVVNSGKIINRKKGHSSSRGE